MTDRDLLTAAFIAIGVVSGVGAAIMGTNPRGKRHEFFTFLVLSTAGFFSAISMFRGAP